MQSALDIGAQQLKLLSSLDKDVVAQTTLEILQSIAGANALAVIFYDPDFEALSERNHVFVGQTADKLSCVVESVLQSAIDFSGGAFKLAAQEGFGSIIAVPVMKDDQETAVLLVAGDDSISAQQLDAALAPYPLGAAFGHCLEVLELLAEVSRVREQYELLEADHEELKRQIAEALGADSPATFREDKTKKEQLVYKISNTVRSSLDVQEVLQSAVNHIGNDFNVSRCLVIWPLPDSEEYNVYEFCKDGIPPSKELLFSEHGKEFVRHAAERTAPLNFGMDGADVGGEVFNQEFLKTFGLLSGMLVPLIYQDRNIGSLFLQDCVTPREWSIDHTALIGSLADLVTVAIEHANMHEEKKRQAVTDGLTGIANRRHFNDTFGKEFERAKRYQHKLSLVIVDLDFLKKINDTYGHHVGDEAIKLIGAILGKSCRAVDLAARFGGEEFCLLLPDTSSEEAKNLAERIRARIASTEIPPAGTISASLGVATYPEHGGDSDQLFEAADQALYAAKQGGRNQVVIARPIESDH